MRVMQMNNPIELSETFHVQCHQRGTVLVEGCYIAFSVWASGPFPLDCSG
jgi:hypothetical protein